MPNFIPNLREDLEPENELDFEGLRYKRRYIVPDYIGEKLEQDGFRASAEKGIKDELRHIGPLGSRPRISVSPAGRHVSLNVEIGSKTLDSTPRSKGELDVIMDKAMEKELDGELDVAKDGITTGDFPVWEVDCK